MVHGTQLVRASELNTVVVSSYPTQTTFYSYFKESIAGEYHMYQFIPLHLCNDLKEILIKLNVATDEGNIRNEI